RKSPMVRFIRPAPLGLGACLWLLLAASPALAGPVSLTFDGPAAGQDLIVTYKGDAVDTFAGQFKMHLNDQPGNTPGPEFLTFCVDFDHDVTTNYSVNLRSTADGLNNGGAVAFLYQAYGQSPLDNQHAAALQLAIWDESIDGGDGLSLGLFRYSGDLGLANLVATYGSAAVGHSAPGQWLDASPSGDALNRGQSVLVPSTPRDPPPPPPVVAPEPTSFALLGLGGVALALWRRRKAAA